MTIGEKIKLLRKNLNLTQSYVADFVGVTPAIISMYEQDRRSPSVNVLTKLSNLFQIDIDDLLGLRTQIHIDELTNYFNSLNDAGKNKLLEYAKDLSSINKYLKGDDFL